MSETEFYNFLLDSFKNMYDVIKHGGSVYVFHADTEGLNFRNAFKSCGFKLAQCLIWVKNTFVIGRQDYQWRHEPILYGWKEGAGHYFTDDRKQSTVLEFDKPSRNAEHPTMKPVDLLVYLIKNSSKEQNLLVGCTANSVMQINSDTVAISLNNDNYTTKVILEEKKFAINILPTNTDIELIKTFGFKKSNEVNFKCIL